LTNSETSQSRIRRYYRREAEILHPPVDIDAIPQAIGPGAFWLAGGRLVGYKRFDLIVRAFSELNLPLTIFGIGPELNKLRRIATPNIRFLGHVSDETKGKLYRDAIAFISPQLEDFGITMVEAMAAGRPVITYGQGGGKEIVQHNETGLHLKTQNWEELAETVNKFQASTFDPVRIHEHAASFSPQRFTNSLTEIIDHALAR
jgi:glycosyltransferase involved in cell wall biosynthesis